MVMGRVTSSWGPLIPRDPSNMKTSLAWGPLIPREPSYLGTPYLGTPYTSLMRPPLENLVDSWLVGNSDPHKQTVEK